MNVDISPYHDSSSFRPPSGALLGKYIGTSDHLEPKRKDIPRNTRQRVPTQVGGFTVNILHFHDNRRERDANTHSANLFGGQPISSDWHKVSVLAKNPWEADRVASEARTEPSPWRKSGICGDQSSPCLAPVTSRPQLESSTISLQILSQMSAFPRRAPGIDSFTRVPPRPVRSRGIRSTTAVTGGNSASNVANHAVTLQRNPFPFTTSNNGG